MAINDISLTAGMRSNLLSLQDTVTLLNRTQSRLSTGKKVNSAIDNPVSFFASQSLNSRASVIDSLKDAMGQAVQTITSADKGIKAITAMIEQAKGIAQSALSADTTAGDAHQTATITLSSFAAGSVLTIGGTAFTATDAGTPGTHEFYMGGTNVADAEGLAKAINDAAIGTYTASASGNVVTIKNSAADVTAGNITVTAGATAAYYDPSNELATLQAQFNTMRTQIDDLAADSGYKGKNLLSSDETLRSMTVKFEGSHELAVTGFDATTGVNGLNVATAAWTNATSIETSITSLDNALTKLRQQASSLSGNLSVITVRQDFSNNMINTLTEGANKLTLADTNEEGANMLMLQTRQSPEHDGS